MALAWLYVGLNLANPPIPCFSVFSHRFGEAPASSAGWLHWRRVIWGLEKDLWLVHSGPPPPPALWRRSRPEVYFRWAPGCYSSVSWALVFCLTDQNWSTSWTWRDHEEHLRWSKNTRALNEQPDDTLPQWILFRRRLPMTAALSN